MLEAVKNNNTNRNTILSAGRNSKHISSISTAKVDYEDISLRGGGDGKRRSRRSQLNESD